MKKSRVVDGFKKKNGNILITEPLIGKLNYQ